MVLLELEGEVNTARETADRKLVARMANDQRYFRIAMIGSTLLPQIDNEIDA